LKFGKVNYGCGDVQVCRSANGKKLVLTAYCLLSAPLIHLKSAHYPHTELTKACVVYSIYVRFISNFPVVALS
jgi:hypothetical protein